MKNLILITIVLCSNWALGQNKTLKRYSGIFEGGTASYTYYENNYERIYNGNFSYSSSVARYDGLKVNINGTFSDNYRNGKWIFTVKSVKSPVSQVLDAKDRAMFQFILSSPQLNDTIVPYIQEILMNNKMPIYQTYSSFLKGDYIAGKLDGTWIFEVISSGGKGPMMTTKKNPRIYSTATFKNNKIIGNFLFELGNQESVHGQFDNNGMLTGRWIINWVSDGNRFQNISEMENGRVINMTIRNISTGEIISQGVQKNKGTELMNDAIMFWLKPYSEEEFKELPINKRNYMYRFSKGIIKPVIEYKY